MLSTHRHPKPPVSTALPIERSSPPQGEAKAPANGLPPLKGGPLPDPELQQIRDALRPIETDALTLHWADTRPWKPTTHVQRVGALLEVDLHDLNAGLARRAVRASIDCGAPAIRFVTGRGRHSLGPGGVLGKVVRKELRRICKETGWTFRPAGAARWVLITDPERAPASATGELGWGFTLLWVGFALAALVAFANMLGLIGN